MRLAPIAGTGQFMAVTPRLVQVQRGMRFDTSLFFWPENTALITGLTRIALSDEVV